MPRIDRHELIEYFLINTQDRVCIVLTCPMSEKYCSPAMPDTTSSTRRG